MLRETGPDIHKMAARNFTTLYLLDSVSKGSSLFYYVAINGIVAVLVFLSLALFNGFLRQYLQYPETGKTNTCKLPNCIRCRAANLQRDILLDRLHDFVCSTNTNHENLERLFQSLLEGHKNSDCVRQRPTTFGLLGLSSKPLHNIYSSELRTLANNFTDIKLEVRQIAKDLSKSSGWVKNVCPTGCWYVYHLYNQGRRIDRNCSECPRTAQIVESVMPFMKDCVFGNALISLIRPGTHITPHYGPTNCRLRCHLPLDIPEGCKIIVDQDEKRWKEGHILIFDDSYLHEVYHSGHKGDRVVLILDLWHPEVTSIEKRAINCVFANAL